MRKIPTFKLIPEPLDDEARNLPGFRWASKEIGTRHQLGGNPNFLQDDAWPNCVVCRRRMTFYAQLDSISDDICIADCGMVYVFICFDCFETTSLIHAN